MKCFKKFLDVRFFLSEIAAVLFLGSSVICLGFWTGGVLESEFWSHPDEPAHLVTSIMVADYCKSSLGENPIEFAKAFYSHYPKVGFGHWPPMFHVLLGAWVAASDTSRPAILSFMAFITLLTPLLLYVYSRKLMPMVFSLAVSLTYIALPKVQIFTGAIMTESMVTLFSFIAVLAWKDYSRDYCRASSSMLFGVFASAAILTKGSGFALALLPLLLLLTTQNWFAITKLSFWLPPLIVTTVCGPYYWFTLSMQRNGMQHERFSIEFLRESIPFYSFEFLFLAPPVVFVLALAGLLLPRILPSGIVLKNISPKNDAKVFGLHVLSVYFFQIIVPCGTEWRHLLPMVPSLLALTAIGLSEVLNQSKHWNGTLRKFALALFVISPVLSFGNSSNTGKPLHGFREVVERIKQEKREYREYIALISAGSIAEGGFVAEFLLADVERRNISLRGSKLFVSERWDGRATRNIINSESEMKSYIDESPIDFILVDPNVPKSEIRDYHRLLTGVLEKSKDWVRLASYDILSQGICFKEQVQLFKRLSPPGSRSLELQMGEMTGQNISLRKDE
jgi:hypothetical protein